MREALADTPVVVIEGARQVGKSTPAAAFAREATNVVSVTLDGPGTLAIAEADPVCFVERAGRGLLVIDEAQRAPSLVLPLDGARRRFLPGPPVPSFRQARQAGPG